MYIATPLLFECPTLCEILTLYCSNYKKNLKMYNSIDMKKNNQSMALALAQKIGKAAVKGHR